MPYDVTKNEVPIGKAVYQWTVPEYQKYHRPRRWYIFMGVLASALIFYAIWSGNFLFALILVLFGLILFFFDLQEPKNIPVAITETGIVVGRTYYRYNELQSFWFVYNPPEVKTLYFATSNVLNHRLHVSLLDYDPRPIRELLSRYLHEDLDQEEEPFSDKVARMFRIY